MNGLKLFEQAQFSLDQGDYENVIALLCFGFKTVIAFGEAQFKNVKN